MEYKVGDIIRVLPNTQLWEEFENIVEGYGERLEDVNSWVITRVRENDNDDTYKLRVDNTINNRMTGWNMIPNQVALVDSIREDDIVTISDEDLKGRYLRVFEITEDQLVGKVEEVVKEFDKTYAKVLWDFAVDNGIYTIEVDKLKLVKRNTIEQPLTLFTTEYPFVKSILDEMYGDNYDIQEEESTLSRLKADIILKYPEITIKNKNDESHIIRDLYVKIQFNRNKIIKSLEGFRGTVTDREAYCGYNHSHLPSGRYNTFESFCLGSGTETQFVLAECYESFNEDSFTKLLGMIDSYVEYESLEGGPHIFMSSINTKTSESESISSYIIDTEYINLKNSIKENLPIKYIQGEYYSTFEIDSTSSELEGIMNKYITKKSLRNKTNGEIFNNISVNIPVDEYNEEMVNNDVYITFKNEQVYKKVIKSEEEVDLSQYEQVANPKVVKGVVEELNKELKAFKA